MVALLSFAALSVFQISFLVILPLAALTGWLGHRILPLQFPGGGKSDASPASGELPFVELRAAPAASWKRSAGVLAVCLGLWWLPILGIGLWLGRDSTAFQQGVFFSKTAMVTFGGAYAVLPYVAQQAVEHYHWLSHPQMMSGLGLAETTPGPLIMVLQFVGFAGGWQNPGTLTPLAAASLGAFITTWATFLPCFLWVFLGAPHIGRLHEKPAAAAALTAITAAVTGAILHLAVTFAGHAILPAHGGKVDWFSALLAVSAFAALHRFKAALLPVLASCALAGMMWRLWWL